MEAIIIKNLLSASCHKGFVLVALLPWIALLMMFYSTYSLDLYHRGVQVRLLSALDQFSLVEMVVLHKTKNEFLTFDPQDFSMELATYHIEVTFDDEIATILFDETTQLYGFLHFDMVYGYVISYRVERNGVSD
jgi:hypothetical protein